MINSNQSSSFYLKKRGPLGKDSVLGAGQTARSNFNTIGGVLSHANTGGANVGEMKIDDAPNLNPNRTFSEAYQRNNQFKMIDLQGQSMSNSIESQGGQQTNYGYILTPVQQYHKEKGQLQFNILPDIAQHKTMAQYNINNGFDLGLNKPILKPKLRGLK